MIKGIFIPKLQIIACVKGAYLTIAGLYKLPFSTSMQIIADLDKNIKWLLNTHF